MITWWLQLAEATPIERSGEVLVALNEGIASYATNVDWNWDGDIPQSWSALGDGAVPIESVLPTLQPLLGEHERLIFVRMVLRAAINRVATEYHIVTRNLTATLSGQALVQRAVYLSRIAEEDLEKAQNAFDGHPDPG